MGVIFRFDGARLMVVKGNKNLKHCALLDSSSPNPDQVEPWEDDKSAQGGEITVTFRKGEQDVAHELDEYDFMEDVGGTAVGKGNKADEGKNQTSVPSPRSKSRKNKLKTGRRDKYYKGVQTAHESRKIYRNRNRQHGYNQTTPQNIPIDKQNNSDILQRSARQAKAAENVLGNSPDNHPEEPPNPVGLEVEPEEEMGDDEEHGEGDEEVFDEEDIRSSGSSFAKNLWSCYGGDTLFTQTFSSSLRCQSQDAMMKYALRMRTVHEITSTGYYYYIFYSDNDIVSNDIFARFNIEKVVYSFPNYTHSCINTTQCSLPLNFLSSEKVLLEVPLQDGVSDEDSLSQMILISSCRPRLGIYFIFPVSILFLIMCCAFM